MKFTEFLIEYRRDVTAQKLGDKLLASAKREGIKSVDQILAALEDMDPTANKQYTLWIANQYIKDKFRLEDGPRIKTVLERFMQAKSRLPEKDIGRYDFYQLEDAMEKIFNPAVGKQELQTTDTFEIPEKIKDKVEVLYNGPLGLLAIPNTEEASCVLGSGTRWCTASRTNNMFDEYSGYDEVRGREGCPLYIWRDKNGEKYQFYFNTYNSDFQFMNSKDRPIDKNILKYFRTEHPVLKKMFQKEENHVAIKSDLSDILRYIAEINDRVPAGEKRLLHSKDPGLLYDYALNAIQGRWPEAENIIAKNPDYAYFYARDVIRGQWPEAEKIIAKNPNWAYQYARDIIKGKFPEGEKEIASDPFRAYAYAKDVIGGRWPEAENRIASDPFRAYAYAKEIIRGQWSLGEKAIAKNPNLAYAYAKEIIRGRWPEAEKGIAKDPENAYYYAKDIIRGRWPEAENIIAKNPSWAYGYARDVIHGRWPEAEETIAKDSKIASSYRKFLNRIKNKDTKKNKIKETTSGSVTTSMPTKKSKSGSMFAGRTTNKPFYESDPVSEIKLDKKINKTNVITRAEINTIHGSGILDRLKEEGVKSRTYKYNKLPGFSITVYEKDDYNDVYVFLKDAKTDDIAAVIKLGAEKLVISNLKPAAYKNLFEVYKTQVFPEYQGRGLGKLMYEFLVNRLRFALYSGHQQSIGSMNMWKKLFNNRQIKVMALKFNDLGASVYPIVLSSKTKKLVAKINGKSEDIYTTSNMPTELVLIAIPR